MQIEFRKKRELAKQQGIPLESQHRQAEVEARRKAEVAAERQKREKERESREAATRAREDRLKAAEAPVGSTIVISTSMGEVCL